MNKIVFKVIGGFALGIALLVFGMSIFVIWRYPVRAWQDIIPLVATLMLLTLSGVGLFFLRKWAAVMISAMALYVASLQIEGAIHPIHGQLNWLGFVFALMLAMPSIVTMVYWKTLSWRARTPEHVE